MQTSIQDTITAFVSVLGPSFIIDPIIRDYYHDRQIFNRNTLLDSVKKYSFKITQFPIPQFAPIVIQFPIYDYLKKSNKYRLSTSNFAETILLNLFQGGITGIITLSLFYHIQPKIVLVNAILQNKSIYSGFGKAALQQFIHKGLYLGIYDSFNNEQIHLKLMIAAISTIMANVAFINVYYYGDSHVSQFYSLKLIRPIISLVMYDYLGGIFWKQYE